jgi:hypothetical protein
MSAEGRALSGFLGFRGVPAIPVIKRLASLRLESRRSNLKKQKARKLKFQVPGPGDAAPEGDIGKPATLVGHGRKSDKENTTSYACRNPRKDRRIQE